MPALVTPFDASGDLDLDSHLHNLSLLWERGVRGFLIGGSNGEGPYLDPGERAALVGAARTTTPGAFVLCGVIAQSLRQAQLQAEEAAAAGADAVLILSPTTLIRGNHAAVAGFFAAAAAAAPLPVLMYSMPRVTAYEIPEDLVITAAGFDNIVGIKDSGGDADRILRLLPDLPDGFGLFVGPSAILGVTHAAGARGAITASANYVPDLVADLIATARSGEPYSPLQERLTALIGVVESYGVAGLKEAARRCGLRPGLPRAPLQPLAAEAAPVVAEALETAGIAHE